MSGNQDQHSIANRFADLYGSAPGAIASAPGRLEVLGNHTDYNAGLTLSCAVDLRCAAAIRTSTEPVARLSSTMFDGPPRVVDLRQPGTPARHWTGYVLGLVDALNARGHAVPGFDLLVDSMVPRSAGVSSSAAMEMAVLTALLNVMSLQLDPIEMARIGQEAESKAIGARTGLLDQLSSLLGRRDGLVRIDFKSLQTDTLAMPVGWCFVAVDSGVKHDLSAEYNDRRAACEAAAAAMGVPTLREADLARLENCRSGMTEQAYGCATHILGENQRVRDAVEAIAAADVARLGSLMFDSHASSRDNFQNSCPQLDELVDYALNDERCAGARLSGGGFGGITIHLVRQADSRGYLQDLLEHIASLGRPQPWSTVCRIDAGARVLDLPV